MPLRKRIVWVAVVVGLASLTTGFAVQHIRREPAGMPTPPELAVSVSTRAVRLQDVQLDLDALGSVMPLRSVKLRTQVGGQLLSTPFREGGEVAKGQVVAVIDPRVLEAKLKQANGARMRDGALLKSAQIDLARYRGAARDGSGTQQAVDTQVSLVDQYKAALLIDQGAIDELKVQIGFTRLRAPMAGRIGLRQVDAGNVLADDDPQTVATVDAVTPIAVVFPLPQEQIEHVLATWRREKTLAVDALDSGMHRVLDRGRLLAIDNAIDPSSGTVNLKATFANPNGVLFPSEFVNARLSLGRLKNALVVAQTAVRRGRDGDYLYTIGADRRAVLHRVQRGPTVGRDVVVTANDLKAGDAVVVDGADRIEGGSLVSATEAAANNDDATSAAASAGSTTAFSSSPSATDERSDEGGAQ